MDVTDLEHTERLLLRAPRREDAGQLVHIATEHVEDPAPVGLALGTSQTDVDRWIAEPIDDFRRYHLVALPHSRPVIAAFTLGAINYPEAVGTLTARFDPDADRTADRAEALALVLRFAFAQVNLHKVLTYRFAEDEPTAALLDKVGFVVEGRLRRERYHDGRYHDIVAAAVLRSEWTD